jgi:hypothetical protein
MQAAVAIRADMARLRLAHDAVHAMFTDMCAPGGPWDGAEYSLLVRGSVARGYGVDLPGHPCDLDVDVLFKDTRGDAAIRCSPFSLADRAIVPNDFPTFTACVQDMAAAVDTFLGGAAAAHHAAAIHRQAGGVTRSLSLRVAVAGHVDVEVDVFPKRHQTVGGLPGGAVEHRIKSFGGGPRFAGDEVFQYPVAPMNWYDLGGVLLIGDWCLFYIALVLASSKVLPCLRLCNEQGSCPADSSGSSPSARQAAREDAPSRGEELPPEHPQGLAGWE